MMPQTGIIYVLTAQSGCWRGVAFCTPLWGLLLKNLNIAVGLIGQFLRIQVSEDLGERCGSFGDQIEN